MNRYNMPPLMDTSSVALRIKAGTAVALLAVTGAFSSCGSGPEYTGGSEEVVYPAGTPVYESYRRGEFRNQCGVLSAAATDVPEGQAPAEDPVAYSHKKADLPPISTGPEYPYDCGPDKYVWLPAS